MAWIYSAAWPGFGPPYTPLLRSVAARTVPDLWTVIREAFTRFKSDECRNYLAAARYDAYDPT